MTRLLDALLWPSGVHCLCCDCVSRGALLCKACRVDLDALRRPEAGRTVRSLWRHDGVARQLVIGLKHGCVGDCAEVLAEGIAETVRHMGIPDNTVLTWVTMPEERLRERGIDHGRLLCEAVARQLGLPVRQLLGRRGDAHTQQGLTRAQRLANLDGTFTCNENLNGPVLLIDDVMTTGATSDLCREMLHLHGATAVYVVTATRAELDRKDEQNGLFPA